MINIKAYGGINIKELQLLGKGTQGRVYRIDSESCIKVFNYKRVCEEELKTLMMAQGDIHFPKLYFAGENYIVRECIDGIEINKYLYSHPITAEISAKLIELYESMMKVGFTRLDSAIFHIFITPQNELKLIDTAKALKKRTIIPALILGGLKKLGYKDEFLSYAKSTKPDLYRRWTEG